MRDSISQDDTESLINGYTHPAPGVSASERSIREDSDREEHQQIKDVIKRYVGQLLHGCDDVTCTETLCDTGRRNTSRHPVRTYTPRSARAIALALASRPKPRSRLCPRFVPDPGRDAAVVVEGPRDPNSFMQQLAETPSISSLHLSANLRKPARHIALPSGGIPRDENFDRRLQYHMACLKNESQRLIERDCATLAEILDQNRELAEHLCCYFQCILDNLPLGDVDDWRLANKIVSSDCAYPSYDLDAPSNDSNTTLLAILDALDHAPTLQFLHDVMTVLTMRWNMEDDSSDAEPCDAHHTATDCRRLLCHLADKLMRSRKQLSDVVSLVVLLKKFFLQHWNSEIQTHRTLAYAALSLMGRIRGQAIKHDMHMVLREGLFLFPAVTKRLDLVNVAGTWIADLRSGHVLDFGFLFTIREQMTYFRIMNHLRMAIANSDAEKARSMREKFPSSSTTLDEESRYLEDRFLVLNVSRGNVLQDSFDQLWHRRSGELLRPLRVRLGETEGFEIGQDLGGVQIEFFNLICKEILNESNQLFTTNPQTGYSYFRACSLQPLHMFELCGLLFALAIYNGISLPVNFPKGLYIKLAARRGFVRGIVHDVWPDIFRSLKSIEEGDIAGIDNTIPLEANGLRLTILPEDDLRYDDSGRAILPVVDVTPIQHHTDAPDARHLHASSRHNDAQPSHAVDVHDIATNWPGWRLVKASEEPSDLTNETKGAWAERYAHWLTWYFVEPQFDAFKAGFQRIFPNIDMLSARNLKLLIEGTTHLEMNKLISATEYEGFNPESTYIADFWTIVLNWPEDKQKQLLKFVTAVERIPPGGASQLHFKIARVPNTQGSTERLPTSSTCFGTLYLPEYESMQVLDRKLSQALKYGVEGFGSI